jgi:glycine/D-amino acid oxidase-like deaminating enzyme
MKRKHRDPRTADRGVTGLDGRRAFLKSCAALGAAGLLPLARAVPESGERQANAKPQQHVAVIGAGAFGGWTALHLLRRGAKVTLLDAWGPGNSRASSGGETRVIRATYGPDRIYVEMVARSLELWREAQEQWRKPLLHRSGALWMVGRKDDYERASMPLLKDAGIPFETLTPAEAARRFPQIQMEGVQWALYEPGAGYLMAREACQAVMEAVVREGGEYRQASVQPGAMNDGAMKSARLSDGSELAADQFVFACGPWLGKLFPDVLGNRIRATRQEVFFFGPPPGDARFAEGTLPVWIDNGERLFYGIPANRWRGFKLADDTRGREVDPTTQERAPTPAALRAAREYMEFRFPGMKGAPLVESRVCQYENSPDTHFILDRHPRAGNVTLLGGGSGHGFKHGPALGEMAANFVLNQAAAPAMFRLSRF